MSLNRIEKLPWHDLQRKDMEMNWPLAISYSCFQHSDEASDMEQNRLHTHQCPCICIMRFIKLSSNNHGRAQHMGNEKQGHLKGFTKTGSPQPRMNWSMSNTNSTMWGNRVQITRRNRLISQNLWTCPGLFYVFSERTFNLHGK